MTVIHVVAMALALAASANAQIRDSTGGATHGAITINQCDVATPIIAGAPVFYEHMIQRPVKGFLLESMRRDFAGRTRTERQIVNIRPGLRPSKQVAPDQAIPRYLTFDGSTRVAEPESSSAPLSQLDLGTQLINDVQAEGQRTTQRFSDGAYVITDNWTSPEVNRVILVRRYDGPSKESTMHIDLSRHPSDPSFFAVPEGYTIVDETGPFSIPF